MKTKWVSDAWEKIKKQGDMIVHSFLKCGLSNNFNGTEDDQIKIRVIEDYTMSSAEKEFTLLKDDKESGRESEFTLLKDDKESGRESEFTLLKDDKERGSESEFTDADTDYSNELANTARKMSVFGVILVHIQSE